MSNGIHITTARKLIDSGDPIDLKAWKQDGSVLEMHRCVGLRYNFRNGTRTVKVLASREIRTVRDVCIFEINGLPVFL